MAQSMAPPGPARRAPRLSPREHIAPHITRVGRFARLDPLRPARRPTLPRILGALGWAVLTVEAFRRARQGTGSPGG